MSDTKDLSNYHFEKKKNKHRVLGAMRFYFSIYLVQRATTILITLE
jgi:hypothetical protein